MLSIEGYCSRCCTSSQPANPETMVELNKRHVYLSSEQAVHNHCIPNREWTFCNLSPHATNNGEGHFVEVCNHLHALPKCTENRIHTLEQSRMSATKL
jgi:hypothetical protein